MAPWTSRYLPSFIRKFLAKPACSTIKTLREATFNLSSRRKAVKEQLSKLSNPPTDVLSNIQDTYIPLSHYTIVRHVLQRSGELGKDSGKLREFVNTLDSVLFIRYYNVLQELKALFDPINPTQDHVLLSSIMFRPYVKHECLDKEFWLLRKLEPLMERGGFRELTSSELDHVLKDKISPEGIVVSVRVSDYDTLKVWILGRQSVASYAKIEEPIYRRLYFTLVSLIGMSRPSLDSCMRVVVAARLKNSSRLHLKMCSDVPIDQILLLLPKHHLRISRLDQLILKGMGGLFVVALGAKSLSWYFQFQLQSWLFVSGGAIIVAMRIYALHFERRAALFSRMTQLIYENGVANNRGLLTLLIDRVQDEDLKACLLVYSTLLEKNCTTDTNAEDAYFPTLQQLEDIIQERLRIQLDAGAQLKQMKNFHFNANPAVDLLRQLGLVDYDNKNRERLKAVPLATALASLPPASTSSTSDLSLSLARNMNRYESDHSSLQQPNGWSGRGHA